MKARNPFIPILSLLICALCLPASAQGPAFSYNGHLSSSGSPVTGLFDFRFILFNAEIGGSQVGNVLTNLNVGVTNGVFTTTLDFGAGVFDGAALWLELAVRPAGGLELFDPLAPRQPILPTPYAIYTSAAGMAATVPWSGLAGVPEGFADGVDNDTTYSAGTGLARSGTVFAIATGGIGTTQLADGAVTDVKLSDGAVLDGKLAAGAVTTPKIADDAVTGAKLADDAVSSRNILDGGITGADLDTASVQVLFWRTTGNTGTIARTHFLGTADDRPLELRIDNRRGMRLEPDEHPLGGGFAPNVIGGASSNMVIGPDDIFVYGVTIAGGGSDGEPNVAGENEATGVGAYPTVGGGARNAARGSFCTVAGGGYNTASFYQSTVGGGYGNTASGQASTIPGGAGNSATEHATFAAGSQAMAIHEGAFVWSDSRNFSFSSTVENGFFARCTGGVKFVTGINSTGGETTGVRVVAGDGAWQTLSDRGAKENFNRINPREVLDRLAGIPLTTWNYKSQERSVRHLGPTAQDFYAAFGLGTDDRHISTIDADGVALAAIQGLNEKVDSGQRTAEARIKQLEGVNTELQRELSELKQLVQSLAPKR